MIFGETIQKHPIGYDEGLRLELSEIYKNTPNQACNFLSAVGASSPYLYSLLIKHSDWLCTHLSHSPEKATTAAYVMKEDVASDLRLAKSRISLVLALCDLAHIRPLEWVTNQLTTFADYAVETILQAELHKAVEKGKLPKSTIANKASAGMVVLAMGKMGAHELNYSSDIDLIFLFDDSRYPIDEAYAYRAIFVQVTKRVFEILNKQRHDGYVFRTDLRLRPNPSVTPVCPAMSSAEAYYVREGRTWERSAFIKARVCAGDIKAGTAFLERLEKFIWRRRLDFAAIGEIEGILTLSREHKGLTGPIELMRHDIKLGRGGIREIEFFAQTRQLSYGGRNPDLRMITTIGALESLEAHGYISETVAKTLAENYRAHRQVEHRIQMLRDAQTHKVPNNEEELDRLRCLMGLRSMRELRDTILEPLESTRKITNMEKLDRDPIATPNQTQIKIFDSWKELNALKSPRAAEIFERLLPKVWHLAEKEPDPEQALQNFDVFLSALNSGVQIFSLFERRPIVLEQVFHIVSLSQPLARQLAQQNSVLDALADEGAKAIPKTLTEYEKQLQDRIKDEGDFETLLIQMRAWKSEEHFKIIYSQLSLLMDTQTAQKCYSYLAESCLKQALTLAQSEMQRRYGIIEGGKVAILAMGKLGSAEMTATSDLDIIVIYDGPTDAVSSLKQWDIRSYYQKLTRTLVNALSSSMSYGRLYEVDMRLRPSGRAGTVATSIDSFAEYQRNKAWVWEHLALTRAKVVAGDDTLKTKINAVQTEILTTPQDRQKVMKEVREMRGRLNETSPPKPSTWPVKKPLGGVLDIELLAQMTVLLNNGQARNPLAQLQLAADTGLMRIDQQQTLSEALIKFCKIEHLKRLLGLENFDSADLNSSAALLFSQVMNVGSLNLLERELAQSLSKNSKVIEAVLTKLETQS